ncbi:hypothetical protein B5S30_g5455 [[Candida] boidinii]|nr:hypothetical protein B5S30_g5455 [[Candida] boidinii]
MLILRIIVITTALLFACVTCEPLSAKNEFLMFFEFFSDRKRFSDTKIIDERVKNDLSIINDDQDFKFKLAFYLTQAPELEKKDEWETKSKVKFADFYSKYKNINEPEELFDAIPKGKKKNGVNINGFAATNNSKFFPGYTAVLRFLQKDILETRNLGPETQAKLKSYALSVAKARYQAMAKIFDEADFYKKCLAKDDTEMTFKPLAKFDPQCEGMDQKNFKLNVFNQSNYKKLPKAPNKLIDDTHQNILEKLKDIAITLGC